MLPGAPQSFSATGPVARNGLSLPWNGFRFRSLHSRINVPGLPLRNPHGRSQARSAFCSTAGCGSPRLRPFPCFCPSLACFRARSASPPASTPLRGLYPPPDQSVLPVSLPISPPSDYARFPFAPRFRLSITSRWKRINVPGSLRFRLPFSSGTATAFGSALARGHGSGFLTLRLPFAHKPAVLFIASPTFWKSYESCLFSDTSRCEPSLYDAFQRFSFGNSNYGSPESSAP